MWILAAILTDFDPWLKKNTDWSIFGENSINLLGNKEPKHNPGKGQYETVQGKINRVSTERYDQ